MNLPLSGPVQARRSRNPGDKPASMLRGEFNLDEFRGLLTFVDPTSAPDGSGRYTAFKTADLGPSVTDTMMGLLGGASDDSAALQSAVNALGTAASIAKVLVLTKQSYTLALAGQITIPDAVGIRGAGIFAGADGPNLTQVTFSGNGGFFGGHGAGLEKVRLTGQSNSTLPLWMYKGQYGLTNVRMEGAPYAVRASRNVLVGFSSCTPNSQISGATGLTNGTYKAVAFTGAGATGATVTVVVSNGTISTAPNSNSIVFDGAGAVSLPCFMMGFAAGALYPNSPAISNAAQAFVSPAGRSRAHNVWIIGAKGIAYEHDGALDFSHLNDIHIWDPTGITQGSVAFRLGHVDGLGFVGCKVFGYDTVVQWCKPSNGSNSFATVIGFEVDYSNVGHNITGPMKFDITGGYMQCIGRCVTGGHPLLILKIAAELLAQADHHISLSDFALLDVDCIFERGAANAGLYNVLLAAVSGKGVYNVRGTADGNSPFFRGSGPISGVVAPSAWTMRYPPSTTSGGTTTYADGYAQTSGITGGGSNFVAPSTGGQVSISTDANGRFTIAHGRGNFYCSIPDAWFIGAAGNNGWICALIGIDATNLTFIALSGSSPVKSAANLAVMWEC